MIKKDDVKIVSLPVVFIKTPNGLQIDLPDGLDLKFPKWFLAGRSQEGSLCLGFIENQDNDMEFYETDRIDFEEEVNE